jgi:hypothetical protein
MKCDNRLTKGKGMTYWSKELKKHADNINKAGAAFREFYGTDCEQHTKNLEQASAQFQADAYEDEKEWKQTRFVGEIDNVCRYDNG